MQFALPEVISITVMIVGVASLGVSIFVASHNKTRTQVQDEVGTSVKMERILTTTETTQRDVSEMKHNIAHVDKKIDEHTERILVLEGQVNTCWKRHDEMKERVDRIEEKL